MNRRKFLSESLLLASVLSLVEQRPLTALGASRKINTVLGPISPDRLGTTLVHEHILVDFIGADKIGPDRYEEEEVFKIALPHLTRLYEAGGRTLVDCTPAYLGRNPKLLRRLSEASGLHLITNTGIYGAADDKFVPALGYKESAEDLARRWTDEFENGIEQTGIKPGIIKIGIDKGPLSEIDAKLVRAAALTHRRTGLSIAAHSGDGAAAMQAIELLKEVNVAPRAFIWVHAQAEKDRNLHLTAARKGTWLEFDGIAANTVELHKDLISHLKSHALLGRVLVSQDAGWYNVGESGGGTFRSYEFLLEQFVPSLRKAGFSATEIRRLLIENPKQALIPRVRKLT